MNTNIRQASAPLVKEGSIIGYLLPGTRRLIWHGRVLRIYPACALVESTEEGYEGMTEYVMLHQVVSVTTTPERVIAEVIPARPS